MHIKKARFGGVAVVLAAALVLAACGDDDDDDSGGGGTATGASAPTGAPIELGLANTENSPAGNYVDSRKGVEAAVEYVNEELGGVNGRPLEVESCTTDGSPETSIACANKFIQGNKLAVMPGIDLSAPGAIPIYSQAGMPYVGGLFTSPTEYTGTTGYSFIGAAAGAVTGIAAYAGQELQAKSVSILGPDIPQLTAAVDGFMKPVLAKTGVTDVNVVTEAATAPDMTPAVTRMNSGDPDAVIILFGGPSCTKAMQAVAQVNIPREKVIYGQECTNKDAIEAGGGGGEGAIFQTAFLSPDADTPNAKIFRDSMEKYSDAAPGVSTATGFDSIMNLYEILKTLDPNNITRETLIAALKATNNQPAFLSHGYTCNGQQFPGLPALCDTNVRFQKYTAGEFVETTDQWVNGAALLLGG